MSQTVLLLMAVMVEMSHSVIYTSSKKIEEMVLDEEQILQDLHAEVNELQNQTAITLFLKFYNSRIDKAIKRRGDGQMLEYLRHPNGIYHTIKQFAAEYENIRSVLEVNSTPWIEIYLRSIASHEDVEGTRLSFIRLQEMYRLNVSSMARGDYLGCAGPKLHEMDLIDIGEAAFNYNQTKFAIPWLEEALQVSRQSKSPGDIWNRQHQTISNGRILALLGRCYLREGDISKADAMYWKARSTIREPDEHLTALERELKIRPWVTRQKVSSESSIKLCSLHKKFTQTTFDPRLTCSYKEAILPYYRFKQELVSISPYVALFYEVITDQEIGGVIDVARHKLERGKIQSNGTSVLAEYRTSHTTYVKDAESPVLQTLSKRVATITNLKTDAFTPGGDYHAEPFQVVNYGIGGHYDLHHDYYDNDTLFRHRSESFIANGGNRMATFLIYMTDVERGGSTIFMYPELAVSPVKKMALFWYNYTPRGDIDTQTLHAGCPVVVGQKWVVNKWISLYGNTFTRRCGLSPDATQLDIEPYMRTGWAGL